MQLDIENPIEGEKKLFEFFSSRPGEFDTRIIKYGRYIVGSFEGCDIHINHFSVSAIHCVVEITPRGIGIYDMNSLLGTFFNNEKLVARQIALGEEFKVGEVLINTREFKPEVALPPVLPSLDPVGGSAHPNRNLDPPRVPTIAPDLPPPTGGASNTSPQRHTKSSAEEDSMRIVYPLEIDPNSSFSEYIFEDANQIYPIFKYEVGKMSVEVVILYKGKVLSMDYIPMNDGDYKLTGFQDKKNNIEYPYLGVQDEINFVRVVNGQASVFQIPGYEVLYLSDKLETNLKPEYMLNHKEIVKFYSGDREIFLRLTEQPPKVKPAPFFRRDKELRKYLWMVILFLVTPVVLLSVFYQVDEEIEKEKEPERLATILYKQQLYVNKNKTVEKTEKKKKQKQKVKQKVTAKKEPVKTKTKEIKQKKSKTKKVVTKTASSSKTVNKPKLGKQSPNKINPNKTKIGKSAQKANVKSAKIKSSPSRFKSKGNVDVYKNDNFKSTVSNLLAKGGGLRKSTTVRGSKVSNSAGVNVGTGTNSKIESANVSGAAGTLSGTATGKLGDVKSAEGISNKKGVMTAGIPSETVVLGSMDPDIIRRILREHIPQFRYCYQKELDKNDSKTSGVLRLNFTIGASGHVTKAGVDSTSRLPTKVKACVVGVLKGIQFPQPAGGGVVTVKQPLNFYPVTN